MSPLRPLATSLATALLLFGCQTQVEPFLDEFAPPIHIVDGFLDGATDQQRIRVQRIRRSTNQQTITLDEFAVESTAVETAVETTWRDSLIELSDGSTGHMFLANFRPQPGTTHRLTVRDETGETTVSTTVPDVPRTALGPILLEPAVTQPFLFANRRSAPPGLAVSYEVTVPETSERHYFSFSYGTAGRNISGAWEVYLFLLADRNRIGSLLGRPTSDTLLVLNSVNVTFELLSDEWEARDAPGRRDVGFFGSVGSYAVPVPVDGVTRAFLNVQ